MSIKTVKDLLEILSKYPEDMQVGLSVYGHSWTPTDIPSHGKMKVEVGLMKYSDPKYNHLILMLGGLPTCSGYGFIPVDGFPSE